MLLLPKLGAKLPGDSGKQEMSVRIFPCRPLCVVGSFRLSIAVAHITRVNGVCIPFPTLVHLGLFGGFGGFYHVSFGVLLFLSPFLVMVLLKTFKLDGQTLSRENERSRQKKP